MARTNIASFKRRTFVSRPGLPPEFERIKQYLTDFAGVAAEVQVPGTSKGSTQPAPTGNPGSVPE